MDSDADGLPDAWEELHGLSVGENDAEADPDLDELSNQAEFAAGTHPQVADTDADGLSDGAEVNVHRCDPTKVDSDHDGFNDALEVAAGSDPNSAMSAPASVALIGTAIIGTKESLTTGVEVPWANAGVPENINDGDLLTRVDTWNGGNTATMSYVGILWDKPLARAVTRVQLSLAIFSDGGWFGVNGSGPGAGGVLLAAVHLEQPELQITRTGGTEWDSVGSVSADYTIALNGHPLPAVEHGPPTTATAIIELWEPATGINGIRLIGPEGGTASNGFLGVFELVVEALPPSAVEPVTLVVPRRDGPRFGFEFASQLGVAHVVWSKAHLEEEWQIHSTLPGDGMIQTVWDAWTGAQRFYQVTSE